ncbi:MAG: hypothetical protein ACRC1M_05195 [Methanobacteriaceae archaeon]
MSDKRNNKKNKEYKGWNGMIIKSPITRERCYCFLNKKDKDSE